MKLFKNKILLSFLFFCTVIQFAFPVNPAYASVSPLIADFLCEKGVRYYEQGMYPKALQEFKKALLANPESAVAREYVKMIEEESHGSTGESPACGRRYLSQTTTYKNDDLSFQVVELQKEILLQKSNIQPKEVFVSSGDLSSPAQIKQFPGQKTQAVAPKADDHASGSAQPVSRESATEVIDLEGVKENEVLNVETREKSRLLIKSSNITRFFMTDQRFLKTEKLNENELFVEALGVGNSYVHVWDGTRKRKSIKFDIKPRAYDEEFKISERKKRTEEVYVPESFKMNYSIEGTSFMTGSKSEAMHRSSHTWLYRWGLEGETPFGRFDTAIQCTRTLQKTYRISNLRLALTDAHYNQFKNITIRGFDFSPSFGAFGFVASDLRGIMVRAPMFNRKIDYMAFWGALPQGGYTSLSTNSGFSPTKKAWLEGIAVNYRIARQADLKTFYLHSYGPERAEPVLTSDTAGADVAYSLGAFRIGSSVVSDMHYLSCRGNCSTSIGKLYLGLSMAEINKNFRSLLGGNPASGSTSGSLSFSYQLFPTVTVSSSFSGYRDKVFFNPQEPGRPNYNGTVSVNWSLDRHTNLQLDYSAADQKGSNSPSIAETKNVSFRRTFYFFKKWNGYLNYSNSKNKNYISPAQDYNNNRIYMGVNCQLIENLYLYLNKEINVLTDKFNQSSSMPAAQEAGIQYNRQIMTKWPLYLDGRLFYRTERQPDQVLDYLSGQDRLEASGGLTLKPNKDSEIFLKCRVSKIWSLTQNVENHLDLDFNWGLRLLWDTGLKWDTMGNFEGFVFYDANGDGKRQPQEKGIAGAVIIGPSNKTVKTDDKGYYKISHVSGQIAYLELDLSTIPKKHNPTTAAIQKKEVVFGKTQNVDFGIATRSDIEGVIFNDKNKNGKFDPGEPLIEGIIVVLDGKEKMVSNIMGAFRFRNISSGEHTVQIDLKTIPVKFIPKVPISKKIILEQGVSFSYLVPLEETK